MEDGLDWVDTKKQARLKVVGYLSVVIYYQACGGVHGHRK